MQTVMAYVPVKRALNASIGRAPATDLTVNFVKYFINHLTATQKNNPYANCFLVKIKLFLIIYARDKIFLTPGTNIV